MAGVKVLDGGFSTQLQKYLEKPLDNDPLWTATYLKLYPESLPMAHRDFVVAGANVISSASYQASIEGFKQHLKLDQDESLNLIRDSIKLAREGIKKAEEETGKNFADVQVAGSVGPYGAFLHDGSEYTGNYCDKVSLEDLKDWHRSRVEALLEAGADFLALETIPCLKEALALIELLKEFPTAKAWISFSIKDSDTISNGHNFCTVAAKCWDESNQLIAIGANCFHPSLVAPIFKKFISQHPNIPTVVYPNSGEIYDGVNKKWLTHKDSVKLDKYVQEWLDLGIKYIGGCCRTDSEDIRRISQKVQQWRKK